jgi:hypothetical protein
MTLISTRFFCPFVKLNNQLRPAHGVVLDSSNAWKIRRLGGSYGVRDDVASDTVFRFTLPRNGEYSVINPRIALNKRVNTERFCRLATDAIEQRPKIRESLRTLTFDSIREETPAEILPLILVVNDTLIFFLSCQSLYY